MVFRFTVISDTVDDFIRVIDIDPDATFLEFQNILLDSVGFDKDQITSFFICNDSWEKEQEITLIEMDTDSEYDNLVMDSTRLSELIDDEEQKLIFVFDMLTERSFFMELTEIILGKEQKEAKVVKAKGLPPLQFLDEEDVEEAGAKTAALILDDDNDFYGEESLDSDDLDEDGFADVSIDDLF